MEESRLPGHSGELGFHAEGNGNALQDSEQRRGKVSVNV